MDVQADLSLCWAHTSEGTSFTHNAAYLIDVLSTHKSAKYEYTVKSFLTANVVSFIMPQNAMSDQTLHYLALVQHLLDTTTDSKDKLCNCGIFWVSSNIFVKNSRTGTSMIPNISCILRYPTKYC